MRKLWAFEIYLRTIGSKLNVIHCVNFTNLYTELEDDVCRALAGFHAFAGSDYTASFYRKSKIKPFDYLNKNKKVQYIFTSLTKPSEIDNDEKM